MTDTISDFFIELFNGNVVLATIIIALIPLIELKGAIPFATSPVFWGDKALTVWGSFLYASIGCFIVTAVIALVFKPIYIYIKDKKFFKSIVDFFTSSAKKKTAEIEQDAKVKSEKKQLWIKLISVFAFVAIPVPGTGVYTGTCLAVLLGLNFWQTILCVTLGNLVAGIIITTICAIFPEFTTIILIVFLALVLALLIYRIIVHFAKKRNNKNQVVEETNEKN